MKQISRNEFNWRGEVSALGSTPWGLLPGDQGKLWAFCAGGAGGRLDLGAKSCGEPVHERPQSGPASQVSGQCPQRLKVVPIARGTQITEDVHSLMRREIVSDFCPSG